MKEEELEPILESRENKLEGCSLTQFSFFFWEGGGGGPHSWK